MTVRTTIFIDEALLRQVKQYALDNKITMAEVVRRGLASVLSPKSASTSQIQIPTQPSTPKSVPVPVKKGDWGFEL